VLANATTVLIYTLLSPEFDFVLNTSVNLALFFDAPVAYLSSVALYQPGNLIGGSSFTKMEEDWQTQMWRYSMDTNSFDRTLTSRDV